MVVFMSLNNKLGITSSSEPARVEEKISKTKALEIFEKRLLEQWETGTLTDKINDREVYMKGIDASYHYEGYNVYKTESVKNQT